MQEYSIAEAKTHLPRIIHETEKTGITHLTRYGRPVAVILSEAEYTALKQGRQKTSKDALQAFLNKKEFRDIDINTQLFDRDRAKQQERKVQL